MDKELDMGLRTDSIVHFRMLNPPVEGKRFELLSPILHYSDRYRKLVFVKAGYMSDGASGARDIASQGWWVHDILCDKKAWADGTPCSAWQSSVVLYDIMKSEGYTLSAPAWAFFTFAFQRLIKRWK